MSGYKSFVSLCLEHGVYIKKDVMKEIGVSVGDFVAVSAGSGVRRYTFERVEDIGKIRPRDEAFMLLSLFDILAHNHYYFLAEFGLTEKVSWVPKQYGYIIDVNPAFELLNKHRKEYKAFKNLYSFVESRFLDMAMSLRQEGIELSYILTSMEEELTEIKSKIMLEVEGVVNDVEDILRDAFQGADLVIGSGTFFSLALFPFETAFTISGVDIGSFALPSYEKGITINPFLFYWLLSSIFRSGRSKVNPNYVSVRIEHIEGLEDREVPIKKLKLRTYSPSKLCVEAFYYSESDAVQWVRDRLSDVFKVKPYVTVGDFLMPFTVPSVVRGFELAGYKREPPYKGPFVNTTPYGLFIYEGGAIIPKVTQGTQIDVEFFTNPLYDRERPLILDTNVISMVTFPCKVESPFFEAFMKGRKVIIPAIVVYELKRKLKIGKEKRNVTYALTRLREMSAMGLLKLKIAGKFPPEIVVHEIWPKSVGKKTAKGIKDVKSDVRDVLLVLEASRRNGVLFTNDVNLRKLALVLGVPSISYNPLTEDVRDVVCNIYKGKKVHISEVIRAVKEYGLNVRGEEYDEGEIKMALNYLVFLGTIKIEKDYVICIESLKKYAPEGKAGKGLPRKFENKGF